MITKYVALLRGINVGGNNKVAMADLKVCFEKCGFKNVTTYINSGNVLFESSATDKLKVTQLCEYAIEKQFGFRVICCVITKQELKTALDHAPTWWGIGSDKHNAIFVVAPKTAQEVMAEIGEAKPEYEKVAAYEPIIFWSAPLKTFNRTRYKNIVSIAAYKSVTIRNANTAKKLYELIG